MQALVWLVPLAIGLGATFVFLFLRAVREGQYDDLDAAARSVLDED
jgi:cbb3-type cytochrome oxidase maturation protein